MVVVGGVAGNSAAVLQSNGLLDALLALVSEQQLQRMHRYKLQAAEEVTGGYGRELIGTIIGYALPGSRRRAMERLENEAQEAYKTGNFEIALDRFCHYLGLVEADPSTTVVSEMRATLTSNIGACLHNLGDVDGAVEYYERAAQEFKTRFGEQYARVAFSRPQGLTTGTPIQTLL